MVVLITGISSGFGLEMAKRLSADGHKVYGTVRRDVEQLEGVSYIKADVRSESDALRAAAEVFEKEGKIDVLINNAGMGIGGPIEFNTEEEIKLQMDTNFMGQVRFTKAVLPYMRKAGKGRIICFSSLGGLMGLPYQGYYSASKFAIEGFCEALRMEVHQHNIDVVVIEPGDFATGFTAARLKGSVGDEALAAYPGLLKSIECFENEEIEGKKPWQLAAKISKIVACKHPRCSYVISNFEQKLSILVKALVPKKVFSSILRSYYKM